MASASQKPTIGYIGLGNAGHHLASVLSHAGYPLVVRDAESARTASFTSSHDNVTAATGYSSFHDVDILITMLPNGKTVREVLLGKSPASRRGSGAAVDGVTGSGVAEYLKDGAVIVDTSSASPYQTRETGKLLKEVNETLALVDAPVTQEYAFALTKGEATFMVGCDDNAVLEKVRPVLETMGKHVFVMGRLGSGHAMKTLNNYTSAASILGLCDALVAGQKFGLEPERMVDVMNVGTGVNFSTKESFRTDGLTRRFQSGYQLSLLVKDMRIAHEVIAQSGLQSSLSDLIVDKLATAGELAGPGADHTQCIQSWEKEAGVQLKQSSLHNGI